MTDDTISSNAVDTPPKNGEAIFLRRATMSLVIPMSLLFAGGALSAASLTFGLYVLITPCLLLRTIFGYTRHLVTTWSLAAMTPRRVGATLLGLALVCSVTFIYGWLLIDAAPLGGYSFSASP